LTGLPGNPQIEQAINQRIAEHQPLAILYIDLTNFKVYNDEFGWLQGDRVIKMLADHIVTSVSECGNPNDFIGHVGGDDFIVVSTPKRAESIAQQVIARFDRSLAQFYPPEIYARGYVEAVDRRGKAFRAPIVSVAVAIVTNQRRKFEHIGQISASAAEVKKYVKSIPGSQYAFDRRLK
jgi:diguanylate cyclase (GGDEF)-like protein